MKQEQRSDLEKVKIQERVYEDSVVINQRWLAEAKEEEEKTNVRSVISNPVTGRDNDSYLVGVNSLKNTEISSWWIPCLPKLIWKQLLEFNRSYGGRYTFYSYSNQGNKSRITYPHIHKKRYSRVMNLWVVCLFVCWLLRLYYSVEHNSRHKIIMGILGLACFVILNMLMVGFVFTIL